MSDLPPSLILHCHREKVPQESRGRVTTQKAHRRCSGALLTCPPAYSSFTDALTVGIFSLITFHASPAFIFLIIFETLRGHDLRCDSGVCRHPRP